ncbi:MAG: hypothetical protein EAX96_17410 [Candidatus Lokiarchaeota archaeon]|nr:hypothetical protein [Candidatus Lokiarchaeota archaeon]
MSIDKINEIFNEMEKYLKDNKNLNEFSSLLASFNKELNHILKKYATSNQEDKKKLKPYTTFFRYFFEIAVFTTQSEVFFQDPDNFLRLLYLIENRNILIKMDFTQHAQEELENIEKVKPILEEQLKKRLKKIESESK